jgi:DNA-binding NarL/FixJ family response regulator
MSLLPKIRAQIIATKLEVREQLVKLIDDDPRIKVIASVTITLAEEALNQLSPALIIAHSESDIEANSLCRLASKHPKIFFMLIMSDVITPQLSDKDINYVTSVKQDKIKIVIPEIISTATQSIVNSEQQKIHVNEQALLLQLTEKELEILKLTAIGLKIDEIADQLHRSRATVAKHRENLMKKLHMHDRVALTRLAIRQGLVTA